MAQYSDLPAEVRLSIMENLIDDADHRALHSLCQVPQRTFDSSVNSR